MPPLPVTVNKVDDLKFGGIEFSFFELLEKSVRAKSNPSKNFLRLSSTESGSFLKL